MTTRKHDKPLNPLVIADPVAYYATWCKWLCETIIPPLRDNFIRDKWIDENDYLNHSIAERFYYDFVVPGLGDHPSATMRCMYGSDPDYRRPINEPYDYKARYHAMTLAKNLVVSLGLPK